MVAQRKDLRSAEVEATSIERNVFSRDGDRETERACVNVNVGRHHLATKVLIARF